MLSHLREFDYGGREGLGRLSGPLPRWLGECFQKLEELDLSCNKVCCHLQCCLVRKNRSSSTIDLTTVAQLPRIG